MSMKLLIKQLYTHSSSIALLYGVHTHKTSLRKQKWSRKELLAGYSPYSNVTLIVAHELIGLLLVKFILSYPNAARIRMQVSESEEG